jgi:hypothetical protein
MARLASQSTIAALKVPTPGGTDNGQRIEVFHMVPPGSKAAIEAVTVESPEPAGRTALFYLSVERSATTSASR